MAMTKRLERQYTNELINIEEMVPEDHFLRVIEKHFDWNFIYEEVEKLYSKLGRKSIDPVCDGSGQLSRDQPADL